MINQRKKNVNTICEVGGVEGESATEVVINTFTSFKEILTLWTKTDIHP